MARPKREFTDEETKKIEQYARLNCNTETIANALDIPVNTLKRRFGRVLRQKRAEGKVDLRKGQCNLAKISSDMSKFLGKNVLGQKDKQEITTIFKAKEMSEAERNASVEAAKAYKLRLA